MSAPLGFVAGTLVDTPAGPRPVEAIAVGDEVWAFDLRAGERVARAVAELHQDRCRQICEVVADGCTVRGCAPGTFLFDGFEQIHRGAASLSTLSELHAWTGDEGVAAVVLEVIEHRTDGTTVHHLSVDGPEACWFADTALVRHRVPSAP